MTGNVCSKCGYSIEWDGVWKTLDKTLSPSGAFCVADYTHNDGMEQFLHVPLATFDEAIVILRETLK